METDLEWRVHFFSEVKTDSILPIELKRCSEIERKTRGNKKDEHALASSLRVPHFLQVANTCASRVTRSREWSRRSPYLMMAPSISTRRDKKPIHIANCVAIWTAFTSCSAVNAEKLNTVWFSENLRKKVEGEAEAEGEEEEEEEQQQPILPPPQQQKQQ